MPFDACSVMSVTLSPDSSASSWSVMSATCCRNVLMVASSVLATYSASPLMSSCTFSQRCRFSRVCSLRRSLSTPAS